MDTFVAELVNYDPQMEARYTPVEERQGLLQGTLIE
jgi:hypothetical protein